MLNHILVPLDGSDLAREAIEPAKQLLRSHGKFTLVTAIDLPDTWDYGGNPAVIFEDSRKIAEKLLPQAKEYLEMIAEGLRNDNFQVDTYAEFGEAAAVILENAAIRNVDMIVMSTHGRSGLSRWLFGSTTGKVLSGATCPVVVIPHHHQGIERQGLAAHYAS